MCDHIIERSIALVLVSSSQGPERTLRQTLRDRKGKGKGKEFVPPKRTSKFQQKKRKARSKSASPSIDKKGGRKNKKKKKGKSRKNRDDEPGKVPTRKVVRGIIPKHCVCCLCHSSEDDPLIPADRLKWMRPRFEDQDGVEGSQCFYCRRLHRAKATLR